MRLIQRTTRKLRTTEAGEIYLRHCARAVRELELGEAALQSTTARSSGVLKMTASSVIGHAVMRRAAKAYAAEYPDVSLELMLTGRIVVEGVDLAIRWVGALYDSSLIARSFFRRARTCGITQMPAEPRRTTTRASSPT